MHDESYNAAQSTAAGTTAGPSQIPMDIDAAAGLDLSPRLRYVGSQDRETPGGMGTQDRATGRTGPEPFAGDFDDGSEEPQLDHSQGVGENHSRKVVSVYRFRDADGRLLYVGVTGSGQRRFRKHAEEKSWWSSVATIDVEHHESAQEAVAAERRIIQAEQPLYNRQGWRRIAVGLDEVSVDEAARVMALSRGTVLGLIRDGTVPARSEERGSTRQYAIPRSFFESAPPTDRPREGWRGR